MNRIIKELVRKTVGEYELYRVYRYAPNSHVQLPDEFKFQECRSQREFEFVTDSSLRVLANYMGTEARVFSITHKNAIIAACAYWWGDKYRKERHIWDLKNNEAKLVQIYTAPDFRGLGLARALISLSAEEMLKSGVSGLFARIWRSNISSIKAFKRAGWLYTAFVVRLTFSNGKGRRFTLPTSAFAVRRHRSYL